MKLKFNLKPNIHCFLALSLIFCLLLVGCKMKRQELPKSIAAQRINLFIAMPKNVVVFEDLAPLLYTELWDHFQRVGYHLVSQPLGCCRLETKLKALDERGKLVSPDVLTYGFQVRMLIEYKLFDSAGMLLDKKTLPAYRWIFKSQNPVLHHHYLRQQYRDLFTRVAPMLEQQVRRHILKGQG